MRFSFHSKIALIVALAITQGACLVWGVFVFEAWLESSIRDTVHQQVLDDNVQSAQQMAKLIRAMEITDPRLDLPSWKRLQAAVAELALPNEGFVCLTDAPNGYLLCHPKLQARPEFGSGGQGKNAPTSQPKAMGADSAPAGKSSSLVESKPHLFAKKYLSQRLSPRESSGGLELSAGVVQTEAGLEIIAAAELPEIEASVLVHQLGAGIDQAVARVLAPIRPIGLAVSLGLVLLTTACVVVVVRRYESQLAEINQGLEDLVAQRTRSLVKTRNGLIFGLAKLAESRDTDTGEHLERISKYVIILAKQLQQDGLPLSDKEIEDMTLASSLHDIGKVGVPDAVLLKPGRLDPQEREIIEKHAVIGGDCLLALSEQLGEDDFLQVAEEIAYGHHEKWDGTGYPFQRSGEQIPLSARIVAVADVYDALRSRRPYKEGMPHTKAREILLQERGAHFDPVVINAFLAAEDEFRLVDPERSALSTAEPEQELAAV